MARDIGEQILLAEWLFVETVDDIRRRSENPTVRTRYELLGIAPLLRKLLADGRGYPSSSDHKVDCGDRHGVRTPVVQRTLWGAPWHRVDPRSRMACKTRPR